MHEAWKARPVSGEIMTDGPADAAPVAGDWSAAAGPVIDAEYETLTTGRPAPAVSPSVPPAALPPAGLEVLKRDEPGGVKEPPRRGSPLFWAVGLMLAAAAFWASGGHALVDLAALFGEGATRLRIDSVTTHVERFDGRLVLFVDGEAVNEGAREAHVPPLDIEVEGQDGARRHHILGTMNRKVEAGERFAFSSRLEVPKDGVKSVSVRFEQKE
jgi:hypothetical protein